MTDIYGIDIKKWYVTYSFWALILLIKADYYSNAIDESYIGKGRIPASTPIFVYSNNYTPETNPLKLYLEPTVDSPYIEDRLYTTAGFAVVDVYERWLKIKININNTIYFVWLAPHNQCANVYSTCS